MLWYNNMNKTRIEFDLKNLDILWKKQIKGNIRYLNRNSLYGKKCFSTKSNWQHIIQSYFNILVEMEFLVKKIPNLSKEVLFLLDQMNYTMYHEGNSFGRDAGGGSMMRKNLLEYHKYMNNLWFLVLKPMPSSIISDKLFVDLKTMIFQLLYDVMMFPLQYDQLTWH